MAKVKLTVSMAGANYTRDAGDEHECSEAEAKRLIEAGFAVPIAAPKKETTTAKAVKETR